MYDQVVSKEVAEKEFDRFAEEMDLDLDIDLMEEDDLAQFEKQKRRIVTAIMRGSLVINDNGEAVYTPQKCDNKEPITFHERSGSSLMAQDGKKKGHDVRKMYAIMGELAKCPPRRFAAMAGRDIKTCEAIFSFLMD